MQLSWQGADTTYARSDTTKMICQLVPTLSEPNRMFECTGFGYLVLRRDCFLGRCSRGGVQGCQYYQHMFRLSSYLLLGTTCTSLYTRVYLAQGLIEKVVKTRIYIYIYIYIYIFGPK